MAEILILGLLFWNGDNSASDGLCRRLHTFGDHQRQSGKAKQTESGHTQSLSASQEEEKEVKWAWTNQTKSFQTTVQEEEEVEQQVIQVERTRQASSLVQREEKAKELESKLKREPATLTIIRPVHALTLAGPAWPLGVQSSSSFSPAS